MPLQFDAEYYKAIEPMIPMMASAPKLEVHDIQSRRTMVEALFGNLLNAMPDVPDVESKEYEFKSYDGAAIKIYHFFKKESSGSTTPTPALLHCHGGGMILGSVSLFHKPLAQSVSQTSIPLFSVEYRLAPEHQHPTPAEDCYAGLLWLRNNAKEFNVDPSRIATFGESAGGNLAAAITLMARDRGFNPPLAKQILVYPMLDDRNVKPHPHLEPFAVWKSDDNITGWTALLGDKASKETGVDQYAAPARAESVHGLPPTYIDVGELDIFRDEDIKYATRIMDAGISCEFHLYPGVPHGFEAFGAGTSVVKRATENRERAMMTF